jgi:hypothetical protein
VPGGWWHESTDKPSVSELSRERERERVNLALLSKLGEGLRDSHCLSELNGSHCDNRFESHWRGRFERGSWMREVRDGENSFRRE